MIDRSFHIDEIELETMRDLIISKYPLASHSRRAVLLSNLLWQKLLPFFSEYDVNEKKTLTLELFQRTLISNKPLTAFEINEIYLQHKPKRQFEPTKHNSMTLPEIVQLDNAVLLHKTHERPRNLGLLIILLLIIAGSLAFVAVKQLVIPSVESPHISFAIYNQMRHLNDQPIKPIVDLKDTAYSFVFSPLDRGRVTELLSRYDSMLLKGHYLDTLESVAKSQNINPALILSIIGQEQGFIPESNPFRTKIINNPYNLYGSWESRQLSFEKSTLVCCRLVTNLLESCPEGKNPIQWINKTYAEDEKWHIGVDYFFKTLTQQ